MKRTLAIWVVASLIASACVSRHVQAWQQTKQLSTTSRTNNDATQGSSAATPLSLPSDFDSGVPDPGLVDILNLPDTLKGRVKPGAVGELTELEIQGFDFEFLEDIMTLWLDSGCTGYNFSVYRSGIQVASGAGGSAKLPVDGTEVPYTTQTRQEIASMTKTITAMAVLQALEDAGLAPESANIENFLPSFWEKGPGVDSITLAALLSHHSGLENATSSPDESAFNNLQQTIAAGCTGPLGPDDGYAFDYDYVNANYGLALYVFAYLVDPGAMLAFEADYEDVDQPIQKFVVQVCMDEFVRDCYLSYVRNNIFAPSDVTTSIDVYDWDASSSQVLYYNFQDTTIEGGVNDDNQENSGPRGFVMRSREVAKVMSALEKSQNVSSTVRLWMKDLELGIKEFGAGGQTFFYKNGGNTLTNNRGRETILVLCPFDVQIVVNMNSRNNAWGINVDGNGRIDFITAFYLAAME